MSSVSITQPRRPSCILHATILMPPSLFLYQRDCTHVRRCVIDVGCVRVEMLVAQPVDTRWRAASWFVVAHRAGPDITLNLTLG